jgi:hypothetical protein
LVNAERGAVEATIVWRSGAEQQLWIERPLHQHGGKVHWMDTDNEWLRDHYVSSSAQEIQARFPDRGYRAIRRQAQTLGLKRPQRGRRKPKGVVWSEVENAELRAYAAGEMSAAELSARLPGRAWDAIASQGRVLGMGLRRKGVYYQVRHDTREIIDKEDSLRRM